MYHGVLFAIVLACIALSVFWSLRTANNLFESLPQLIILLLTLAVLLLMILARTFALKAQDRAIRAEESLRHFILTGNQSIPILHWARLSRYVLLLMKSWWNCPNLQLNGK